MHKQWLSPLRWRPGPRLTLLFLATLLASLAMAALPGAIARGQAVPTASPAPGCTELIRNGSFTDALSNWQLVGDPTGVSASPDLYQSPPYSLRVGSLDLALTGLSGAQQPVTIPADSPSVILDVSIYTQSAQEGAGADYQEIALLNSSGGLLFAPYRGPANDDAWVHLRFNLASFAGQTVYLRFAVNNDGSGGGTAMYVDDVSLTACSSGAEPVPMPTDTPSFEAAPPPVFTEAAPLPLATEAAPAPEAVPPVAPVLPAMPAGCVELVQNGGFDGTLAVWMPGANPLPPALVTSPVLTGAYAVQLGAVDRNPNSYSSIRQTVSVPFGYARAIVSFWAYTVAEQLSGADRQQFVLLGPGNVVWAVPWKVLENGRTWQQHMYELVGATGQTFDLYFAAVNDGVGGRTALYVDEVHLWGCGGAAVPLTSADDAQAAVAPETPLEVQAVPVPQVYPVETMPPAAVAEQVVVATAAVADTQALPLPAWTEVAIVTPSVVEMATAVGEAPRGAVPVTEGTPAPEIGPAPLILQASPIPATPAVSISVSLTPQPASFLSNITSRLPTGGKLAVIGLVVLLVILLVVALIRGRSSASD